MFSQRLCVRLISRVLQQNRRLVHEMVLKRPHHRHENVQNKKLISQMFQNLGKIQPSLSQTCISQKLMLYNEVVQSCHPGTFHLLPLGQRALEKLIKIIDQEMQAIQGQKISMPTLSPASLWQKSGRWDETKGELFKLKDRHNVEYCLGPTHEELVTELFASISPVSYKRLPILLYQITRKFRDEMAPKFGLLRGREFDMKDMYTFDSTQEDAVTTYNKVCEAYCRIFDRLQVKYVKAKGDNGTIGGSFSHEYHFPASIGEDRLLVCDKCGYSSNVELIENFDESSMEQFCPSKDASCEMKETPGIEVGHTFLLGTKYSSVFGATCHTETHKAKFVEMGCFGLGVTRILQGCVEVLSTEKCIKWPSLIAPYQVCIIPQKEGYKSDTMFQLAEHLSDDVSSLSNLSGEVVIDDRLQMTVGKRLYEACRIGYPYIVVIGKKALEAEPLYEVFASPDDAAVFWTKETLLERLINVETITLC